MRSLNRLSAGFLVLAATIASVASAQNVAPVADQTQLIHISAATNPTAQHVLLALNKATVVELDRDVRDVVVANPLIADAVVKTPRRIFLMSLKIGQTDAIFLDAQGHQIGKLEIIVGADLSDLNEQIAHKLPGAKVRADALNDNIVLSGSVVDVQQASEAQQMADHYAGMPNKVVNNLAIEQKQQVLIQVRVSEMSRTISKQLGINTLAVAKAGGVPIVAATDDQFSLVGRALTGMGAMVGNAGACTPPVTTACLYESPTPHNNLTGVIQALERIGLVHTLAEPNLTAISGEAAKFLAGGEFPVPISRDQYGNITVEYKPFGVGLAFTPVVLSKGRISLQISTEVSELSNTGALILAGGTATNGTVIPGATLPALSVRRTETTVELPSGGSLAIGGLIQQQTKQNLDALPGVKDLPILGALFRSRDFQNNETELVVTVTAYLVNSVAPAELAGPDDGYATPTDMETILLGRLNAVYGKGGNKPPEIPKNALGYMVQ
jgi:pilus assembly protein CpaC